jgi:uncharacterized membrane protein YcaP (DUF421 family)
MELGSDILDVVIRTSIVYLLIVIGLLLLGKKELSQMSVTDLVFILLISNSVQNAMVGNNSSLSGGLIAALVLFVLNYIFRRLNYEFSFVRKVVEGEPVMLVYKGFIKEGNLKREQITHEELLAAVREHGVERIEDVSLAMLEIDGNISVLSDGFKHTSIHKRKKHIKGFLR